jgi:hypothetical protein
MKFPAGVCQRKPMAAAVAISRRYNQRLRQANRPAVEIPLRQGVDGKDVHASIPELVGPGAARLEKQLASEGGSVVRGFSWEVSRAAGAALLSFRSDVGRQRFVNEERGACAVFDQHAVRFEGCEQSVLKHAAVGQPDRSNWFADINCLGGDRQPSSEQDEAQGKQRPHPCIIGLCGVLVKAKRAATKKPHR